MAGVSFVAGHECVPAYKILKNSAEIKKTFDSMPGDILETKNWSTEDSFYARIDKLRQENRELRKRTWFY